MHVDSFVSNNLLKILNFCCKIFSAVVVSIVIQANWHQLTPGRLVCD